MPVDAVQLTQDLIAIPSNSQRSNVAITDTLEALLRRLGFDVERLEYDDEWGHRKASLVARKGQGPRGFCLYSHSDTVPATGWEDAAWSPRVEDGRVIGLGACDMKGPLAATIAAAADVDARQLKKPLFLVVTADEEINYLGARQLLKEARFLLDDGPAFGVVAEPTELVPVYAHKGGCLVTVTAYGVAAHTSTEKGTSANFLIAPFLAEMAELAQVFKRDPAFRNDEFDPPTISFNMTLDDGGCASNVTAAKTVCRLGFRPMPNVSTERIMALITERAQKHNLEVATRLNLPFFASAGSEVVRAAAEVTGRTPRTVPFGTEAILYQDVAQVVVLGPGSIQQAHTKGEWIAVQQLHDAVGIYRRLIDRFCL